MFNVDFVKFTGVKLAELDYTVFLVASECSLPKKNFIEHGNKLPTR